MDLRYKFNEDEINYDRFRPSYPKELFEDIINYSSIKSKSMALEIGIGTGQATLPILKTGCSVTAVELGDKLSRYSKNKFKDYNNFTVINADFMKTSFNQNTFDLIYCGTAFHWLPANKVYEKVKEILKAKGTLALFWNHPFPNRKDDISNEANRKIYKKYRPNDNEIKEFSKEDCKPQINLLKAFGFKNIELKLYHRIRTLTSDEYISLLNTYSDHRALDKKTKASFEKDMKNAIDEIGGNINIYDTLDLYLARK